MINKKKMQLKPNIRVLTWIGISVFNIEKIKSCNLLFCVIGIPVKYFTWLRLIIIAAPEVKPLITGFDRKETKKPIFKTPNITWIIPTNSDNNIAIWIYSPGETILKAPRPAATRSESIATGPTANCLEVPIIV